VYYRQLNRSVYYTTDHTNIEGSCLLDNPFVYMAKGELWAFSANPRNCTVYDTSALGNNNGRVYQFVCLKRRGITVITVFNSTDSDKNFEDSGYVYFCGNRTSNSTQIKINTDPLRLTYPTQKTHSVHYFTKWKLNPNTKRYEAIADNRLRLTTFVIARITLQYCVNSYSGDVIIHYFLNDDNFSHYSQDKLQVTSVSPFVYFGLLLLNYDTAHIICGFDLYSS